MKKICILFMCAFLLSSCTASKKYEKEVFSMDTHITMRAYGKSAEKALEDAEDEIKRIDKKFSIDNIDKNDEETKKLLEFSYEMYEKTGGAFDVRVAPVMRAWGFYSEEFTDKKYNVPTKEELDDAINKMHEGNDLDFGAVAKGYCADRVAGILKESGVESAVISLGGNVFVIGKNTDGAFWTVGIKSPFDEELYATISVSDTAVVTSGDYVRFFEQDGIKYHHIIDPKTGYPAKSDLASVTVVAKNSAFADCLSTALFVMGKDKAIEYSKSDMSFEMILIDKSGRIYYTEGLDPDTIHSKEIIKRG